MHSLAPSHRAPRLVAALLVSLTLLLVFTQRASALAVCNSGGTSWSSAVSGLWDDATNWSNGVPGSGCAASITVPGTYTVTLTPYAANGDSQDGDGVASLTLGAGSGSGTQTLAIEGQASVSNSNETNNLTELGVTGAMQISSSGELILDGTSTGTGNNGPDGGAATLDVAQPSTNAGTIVSQVEDSQWHNAILGQLSNSGTLEIDSGLTYFGGSAITGGTMVLSNSGTYSVASGATAQFVAGDGSSFTNTGGFANSGTTTLSQSMHWIQSGGGESGNPVQLTGGETLEDSTGSGSFEIDDCGTDGIMGTIPAGQTVTVVGGCSGTTLWDGGTGTAPLVNDGTIDLDAAAGASDAIIGGSELDNYGTVNSTVGGALPLANQLLVPLVNESGSTVNLTGGELAQTTGSATSNAGTVNIGPGATWLVQAGSFTNTGTLAPQIAGATGVGTVNLTVGSKFNAGGTLAPTLVSGYTPATGTEFPIVTMNGGSPAGTFGSVTGGFSADYSKETASSNPYLGVIYGGAASAGAGTTGTTGTAGTGPHPTVKKLTGGAGKMTVKLTCAKSAKSACSYSFTGTVGKTKVASGHGTVKAGKTVTVTLKLNRTGTALLKKRHRLRVKLLVSAGGKTLKSATVTVTRAVRSKRK